MRCKVPFKIGVLYGHCEDKAGVNVVKIKKASHAMNGMVVIHPTMELKPRRKILNPMKNRKRASWRRRGRVAAIFNTCHFSRPSLRKNRIRTRYCGFWTWCVMNSFSHCLTRMPSDAVMRLAARLNDQSVFTMTEER